VLPDSSLNCGSPHGSATLILKGVSRMKQTSPASNPSHTPTGVTKSTPELQEQIRLRAYRLYKQHGKKGYELDDWLQAEAEISVAA
jgi:hypothetical protein